MGAEVVIAVAEIDVVGAHGKSGDPIHRIRRLPMAQ
jgi:hypothetical protein